MLPAFAITSGLLAVISIILGIKLAKAGRLLDSAAQEGRDLADQAKKQAERLNEVRKKLARVRTQMQDELHKITADAQKKQGELKKQRDRLQQKLDVREHAVQDQSGSLAGAVQENQALTAQIKELEGRIAQLDAKLDSQNKKISDKADESRRYESELLEYSKKLDHFVNLELKNKHLKETVDSQKHQLNELAKKSEHNRVAWVVTQRQLEMAEDRIHMLLKGFSRPGNRVHDPDVILAELISKQAKAGDSQA